MPKYHLNEGGESSRCLFIYGGPKYHAISKKREVTLVGTYTSQVFSLDEVICSYRSQVLPSP